MEQLIQKPEGESVPGTLKAHKWASVAEELESRRLAGAEFGEVMGAEGSYKDLKTIVRILPFTLKKNEEAVGGFAKRRDVA